MAAIALQIEVRDAFGDVATTKIRNDGTTLVVVMGFNFWLAEKAAKT